MSSTSVIWCLPLRHPIPHPGLGEDIGGVLGVLPQVLPLCRIRWVRITLGLPVLVGPRARCSRCPWVKTRPACAEGSARGQDSAADLVSVWHNLGQQKNPHPLTGYTSDLGRQMSKAGYTGSRRRP